MIKKFNLYFEKKLVPQEVEFVLSNEAEPSAVDLGKSVYGVACAGGVTPIDQNKLIKGAEEVKYIQGLEAPPVQPGDDSILIGIPTDLDGNQLTYTENGTDEVPISFIFYGKKHPFTQRDYANLPLREGWTLKG